MEKVEALMTGYLNPLRMFSAGGEETGDFSAEDLVEFLLNGVPFENQKDLLIQRKKRLAPLVEKLYMIPSDQRIVDKLVLPLRQAYAAFLVGNFLGMLGLCGMVGEMIAIFWFNICDFEVAGRMMDEKDQEALFGRTFERLGQDRRVQILESYRIIPPQAAADLDKIRKIRNNYLHLWSNDHNSVENDAFQVFSATISSVECIFPQVFEKGKMRINQRVLRYLEREGSLAPKENAD